MTDGPVYVWLWTAGRWSGVAGDAESAKERASARVTRDGSARVERAVFRLGMGPVGTYQRLDVGWEAVRPWQGPVMWSAFPRERAALAS